MKVWQRQNCADAGMFVLWIVFMSSQVVCSFDLSTAIYLSHICQKMVDSRLSCIILQKKLFHTTYRDSCQPAFGIFLWGYHREASIPNSGPARLSFYKELQIFASYHVSHQSYYSYVPARVAVTVTVPWACCCVTTVAREGCAGRSVACAIARCNTKGKRNGHGNRYGIACVLGTWTCKNIVTASYFGYGFSSDAEHIHGESLPRKLTADMEVNHVQRSQDVYFTRSHSWTAFPMRFFWAASLPRKWRERATVSRSTAPLVEGLSGWFVTTTGRGNGKRWWPTWHTGFNDCTVSLQTISNVRSGTTNFVCFDPPELI